MMEKMVVKSLPSSRMGQFSLKFTKWMFFGLVLFFLYFPILFIVIQSINADGTGLHFGGFTLRWFVELFRDAELMRAIGVTLSIALLSTMFATALGAFAAVGIHSLSKKNRKRMILLNNVPVLNADIVTGVFLMLVFQVIGRLIGNQYPLGYVTMLIAHIFFSIPYVVLSVLPKLNEIDSNLYDAALDLGSTPREALFKVIFPSVASGIFAGMLLAFTMSIDDFVISYFTTGAGVSNFSIWLYANRRATRFNTWPKAYAYNTIITIGTLVGLVVYNVVKARKKYMKGYKNSKIEKNS
jgi:spermidine/putrescine transport system permease protein